MPCGAFLRREEGRTVYETLLVVALVSVLMVVAIEQYSASERLLKEAALTMELSNLRSAVTHYVILEKKLPESLANLTKTDISVPAKELSGEYRIVIVGKYVETASVDADGWPLDPFGARYGYDKSTGRVWSGSPGYERW